MAGDFLVRGEGIKNGLTFCVLVRAVFVLLMQWGDVMLLMQQFSTPLFFLTPFHLLTPKIVECYLWKAQWTN